MKYERKRKPINITLEDEVRHGLEERAKKHGTSISRVLSALAKIYCRLEIGPLEKPIEEDLKKTFGREQFLSFLKGVAHVLPVQARSIIPEESKNGHDREFVPDKWRIDSIDITIFAYYAPTSENIGGILKRAADIQKENPSEKIIIVTSNVNPELEEYKVPLEKMGVFFVFVSELKEYLGKLMNGKRKSSKKK
ncbi:MAG: hypothetical protein LBV12_11990 [Puniceicoccales bacterium]|jgi:hypothetical protein|nr:hypothetical protein [Puniceicoccales bacterium]